MSRYLVEVYDAGAGLWDFAGSVILPRRAKRCEIAGALVALTPPLYVPRGADKLEWRASAFSPALARISGSDGTPLVRLSEVAPTVRKEGSQP